MQTKISILGCGWLGVQLGKKLIESNYLVKGSTTTPSRIFELAEHGIQPFYLKIEPSRLIKGADSFFDADVLVISVPPQRKATVEEVFPRLIAEIIYQIRDYRIAKVLFISSTSVYENRNKEVREGEEGSPEKPAGRALLEAEQLLLSEIDFATTIIRFGGLIGYGRNPVYRVVRTKHLSGNVPVNLIHAFDCVRILVSLIKKDIWGEVFNACSPEHPSRQEFYSMAAEICRLPAPLFVNAPEKYKIINSDKLKRRLSYTFRYNNPMDYLTELSGEN